MRVRELNVNGAVVVDVEFHGYKEKKEEEEEKKSFHNRHQERHGKGQENDRHS